MNLAQLLAEAREIAQRQSARLQAAIEGGRDLTADEETADAADASRLTELQAQITAARSLQDRLSAVPSFPQTGAAPPAARPPGAPLAEPRARDNSSGFRSVAEFGAAVRLANPQAGSQFAMDPRLAAPANTIMTNGDEVGSFLVPAEFRDEIVSLVYDTSDDPVFDLIAALPTGSNRVTGLGSEVTPWGTTGVQAAWRTEGTQMLTSRTGLKPWEVKLNELYAFVLADEDTLADAPRLQALLTTESAAAIRWKAADGYMRGDGVEKLQGWMNSGALITVAKEAAQAADTITAPNVAKMYARMINPMQAAWLANSDTLPQLMALKNEAGQPVWFPNFQVAPGGTLLGRPVLFTEHANTVGDLGDLQFVNPKGYRAFKKQNGVTFADSIHLFFDYNLRAFRWIFRIGGQPVLGAPATMPNSTNTKSHFVGLAARA